MGVNAIVVPHRFFRGFPVCDGFAGDLFSGTHPFSNLAFGFFGEMFKWLERIGEFPAWVGEIKRVSTCIPVEIRPTALESGRILADRPSHGRIVVARPVVLQAGAVVFERRRARELAIAELRAVAPSGHSFGRRG
jgi:hypothetical protein